MFNLAQHVQEIRRLTADQIVRAVPAAPSPAPVSDSDHPASASTTQQQGVAAAPTTSWSESVPLWVWAVGGAAVVGGAVWWFTRKKNEDASRAGQGRQKRQFIQPPAPAIQQFTHSRAQPIPIDDHEEDEGADRTRRPRAAPEQMIMDRLSTPRVRFSDHVEERVIPNEPMPMIQIDQDQMLG